MCPCATTLVTMPYMHWTTQGLAVKMHTPSTVVASPALIVPAWWGQRRHTWCKSHLFAQRPQRRWGRRVGLATCPSSWSCSSRSHAECTARLSTSRDTTERKMRWTSQPWSSLRCSWWPDRGVVEVREVKSKECDWEIYHYIMYLCELERMWAISQHGEPNGHGSPRSKDW